MVHRDTYSYKLHQFLISSFSVFACTDTDRQTEGMKTIPASLSTTSAQVMDDVNVGVNIMRKYAV